MVQKINRNNKTIIWEDFEKSFSEINISFYKDLQNTYPTLSKNEKRICAFIKLNMSTKDMASLLNISSRGVESARYRLRKKMLLNQKTNLYNFFQVF